MLPREKFRKRLEMPGIILAPGVYDTFSAKIISYIGFEAIYITGAGVAASLLGAPDIGIVGMSEMVECVRRIVDAVECPIISDADTGYGNAINVQRTVRAFEKTGVCAIHLEDQEMPKRCGHLEGKRIVSTQEMVNKLKAAVDVRRDPNFLIIARTDARAIEGLSGAIDRAHAYEDAGADIIFVEAPESEEEMAVIGRSFGKPLLINRGGGGKTPSLGEKELEKMGFKIVIFPGDAQRAAGKAMLEVMGILKETGNNLSYQDRMLEFMERFNILGYRTFQEAEKTYLSDAE